MEKALMEGLKESDQLVQIKVEHSSSGGDVLAGFLRLLTLEQINMNLFIGKEVAEGVQILCTAAFADGKRLEALTDSIPDLRERSTFHAPVGLISIYPHQSSLRVLGLALMAFAEGQLPLHGFCSSLSALTFISDHDQIMKASGALKAQFRFPRDRSEMASR